jgi:hypothetical protein
MSGRGGSPADCAGDLVKGWMGYILHIAAVVVALQELCGNHIDALHITTKLCN